MRISDTHTHTHTQERTHTHADTLKLKRVHLAFKEILTRNRLGVFSTGLKIKHFTLWKNKSQNYRNRKQQLDLSSFISSESHSKELPIETKAMARLATSCLGPYNPHAAADGCPVGHFKIKLFTLSYKAFCLQTLHFDKMKNQIGIWTAKWNGPG